MLVFRQKNIFLIQPFAIRIKILISQLVLEGHSYPEKDHSLCLPQVPGPDCCIVSSLEWVCTVYVPPSRSSILLT